MKFKQYWGNQFGNPTGISGSVATFIMNYMNKAMYKVVLKEIKDNSDVLDIGFGNGYMLKKLLRKSNSSFYGIDISQDMVKLASKKNKKSITKNKLQLAKASVDKIPFKKTFDQIYTINTIYFWNSLLTGFKEIYSKLKTGGEFLNLCYTKDWLDKLGYTKTYKKYTTQEILKAMKKVGFCAEVITIKEGKSFYIKATKIS